MTATISDEAQLRQWLVDYLVTNIGCNPDEVDLDQSLADLGLGSPEAVVLSGELAELLGRPVSPVEFWQHPTINALVGFLTAPESESTADASVPSDRGSVDEPIAVIGLGCRFPGEISGPDALWQFLCEGRSSITEVPADRWVPFDDGSPEVAAALAETTRWGSFLSDVDAFDAEFFEISPREAEKMDPQQRLLLEVGWEALEHAGLPPSSLRRSQTGVFAGACVSEYGYLASTDLGQVDAWTNTGGALSIIANRLSYFLDLRGPSIAVDTACSSSLVAVHLACQSLRMGDSELAIAAGVNLLLSPADLSGLRSSRRVVADGSVSRLRCGRGRVRAGRGLRGGGAQATERCAARRGSGAGGGAGFGGQSGWPIQRADGPESGRAIGGVARGLRQCGRAATRGGLCRDPWNRNTCWAIPSRRVRWVRCWVADVPRTHRC